MRHLLAREQLARKLDRPHPTLLVEAIAIVGIDQSQDASSTLPLETANQGLMRKRPLRAHVDDGLEGHREGKIGLRIAATALAGHWVPFLVEGK